MPTLFDEILLDKNIFRAREGGQFPTTGGDEYANTRIENPASGVVKINVPRTDSRARLTIDLNLITDAEHNYLLNVFHGGYANAIGLRVWVPYFYKVAGEVFGVGDGSETEFPLYVTFRRPGTDRTNPKRITKPVTNTNVSGGVALTEADGATPRSIATAFTVSVNNTPTGAYTINNTTGVITFSSPPAPGAPLSWTGEFDLPMRFLGNSFVGRWDTGVGEIQGWQLEEILPSELGIV